jgi:hypothetical protein
MVTHLILFGEGLSTFYSKTACIVVRICGSVHTYNECS